MLAEAESGPKIRGLEEEEKLKQSSVKKHFVPRWSSETGSSMIIYEVKNENMEGLCLSLT